MKKILPIFALLAFLWACTDTNTSTTKEEGNTEELANKVGEPSEEKDAEENAEANADFPDPDATGIFGAAISAEGAMDAGELIAKMGARDSMHVTLRGDVSSACQAKGCWMTMPLAEEQELMVKFKDYAFFVPKNSGGKAAVIAGWAYKETVSVDELRHYAEDAGKTPEEIAEITEEEDRITFMADGVIIE